jgi:hypothetical protein
MYILTQMQTNVGADRYIDLLTMQTRVMAPTESFSIRSSKIDLQGLISWLASSEQ